MRGVFRPCGAALIVALSCLPVAAQTAPPAPPPQPLPAPTPKPAAPAPPAPTATGVAATVNGQPVPESALQRGLERVPADRRAQARPELLNYLIDNVLIDQHLRQLAVAVEPAEIDKRINDMKEMVKKEGKTFDDMLKALRLTEPELREYITADLRWDKYADTQASEKAVREFFEANKEMFDGSTVRARHVLLTPAANDAQSAAAAQAQLGQMRKEVEAKVAAGLAKLPPGSDNLARAKARSSLTDEAFAALAKEKSQCPSKAQGGDVGWFRRAGFMVEPFSRAAFALKPYEMSDVIHTPFGYHLILVTDRKPGREVKFEDARDMAREICTDRLREGLAAQLRQKATVVVTPPRP